MICLGEDDVIALVSGRLEADAFAAAEHHLDGCRSCRLLVSTLAAKTGDEHARPRNLSAFAPGDMVAERYRIAALLGSGGMGEVYEALDSVLGETIALKTVAAGATLDARGVSRLKAEVQLARRITHRNVCRVFDVGFHVEAAQDASGERRISLPFFTMELLKGETLRSLLRRTGPLPVAEVRSLLAQMAGGIDAAHTAGVIHRDLKTENVMLVPEDAATRVVITDFGLARALEARALQHLPGAGGGRRAAGGSSHAFAGTFGYMAPEQWSGQATGPATDIYALGVVLFELLTGELPFALPDAAPTGAEEPPAPLRSWRSFRGVPPAWEVAIRRCLEPSPAARFQSAGELASFLDRGARPPMRGGRRAAKVSLAAAAGALLAVVVTEAFRTRGPRLPVAPVHDVAAGATERGTGSPPPLAAAPLAGPEPAATAPAASRAPASPLRRARRPRAPSVTGAGDAASSTTPPAPVQVAGDDDFIDPFGDR